MLLIIKAPRTPGIQPHNVNISINKIDPQPLSTTASGGKMIQIMALKIPMTK